MLGITCLGQAHLSSSRAASQLDSNVFLKPFIKPSLRSMQMFLKAFVIVLQTACVSALSSRGDSLLGPQPKPREYPYVYLMGDTTNHACQYVYRRLTKYVGDQDFVTTENVIEDTDLNLFQFWCKDNEPKASEIIQALKESKKAWSRVKYLTTSKVRRKPSDGFWIFYCGTGKTNVIPYLDGDGNPTGYAAGECIHEPAAAEEEEEEEGTKVEAGEGECAAYISEHTGDIVAWTEGADGKNVLMTSLTLYNDPKDDYADRPEAAEHPRTVHERNV